MCEPLSQSVVVDCNVCNMLCAAAMFAASLNSGLNSQDFQSADFRIVTHL